MRGTAPRRSSPPLPSCARARTHKHPHTHTPTHTGKLVKKTSRGATRTPATLPGRATCGAGRELRGNTVELAQCRGFGAGGGGRSTPTLLLVAHMARAAATATSIVSRVIVLLVCGRSNRDTSRRSRRVVRHFELDLFFKPATRFPKQKLGKSPKFENVVMCLVARNRCLFVKPILDFRMVYRLVKTNERNKSDSRPAQEDALTMAGAQK